MVVTPTSGVNLRDALATSVQASPGVYAVLVGSGLSTGAGIKTAWGVAQDLVRRIATSEGVDPDDLGDLPEIWWQEQGRPELTYNTLLEALASTDVARRAILRRYFDPSPLVGSSPVLPTVAHEALASLCVSGYVRVILTTNFDGLIERALEAKGIAPQIVSSAASIRGMTPLPHSVVTLIKLHGDYNSPGLKNTPLEVSTYSRDLKRLLNRVSDDYGLIVVGWSGEFDVALVDSLEATKNRRYPLYCTTYYGETKLAADRLIAQHGAHVIDTVGADEFLPDLAERIGRLDRIARRRPGHTLSHRHLFLPPYGTIPNGWSELPLLVLRTMATVGPAAQESVGLIGPAQRRKLLQSLEKSVITTSLRVLSRWEPANSSGEPIGPEDSLASTQLGAWAPPEEARDNQSTVLARYRLGGDGARGVSALADFKMPHASVGDGAAILIDMGISVQVKLGLLTLAELIRDGLVAVTGILPEAISDILPTYAQVNHCEFHLLASSNHGSGQLRPNRIGDRVDLTTLSSHDAPNPTMAEQAGFAAEISQPLTPYDASELVAYGLNYIALSHGYLDPTWAIASIRQGLGLPPEEM